jgi:exodeoxyribonuclease V beta subunit
LLDPQEVEPVAELMAARRGFSITSYSRLKAERTGPFEEGELDAREVSAPAVLVGPAELPTGRESGLFLHLVLERLRFATVLEAGSFAAWTGRDEVEKLFWHAMRRYDRDPRHLEFSQRLVYDALTTPIETPHGMIACVAACRRDRRELEFLYPVQTPAEPRVFVRGFIDLLFEYDGRIYVLDWKSDALPDYSAPTLAAHVSEHYRVQADLYAVALARLLGAENYARGRQLGGLIYWFLRGRAWWCEPYGPEAIARCEARLGELQ